MGFHLAAIVLVLNKPQTQTTLMMPTLNDADSLSSPRDCVFQEPVGREGTALLEHCWARHYTYIPRSPAQEFLANIKTLTA